MGPSGPRMAARRATVGRNLADPRWLVRIEVKPEQLNASAFDGVKGCHDQLFAILGWLSNRAQIGRGLAQKISLQGCSGTENINSGDPPVIGARMS